MEPGTKEGKHHDPREEGLCLTARPSGCRLTCHSLDTAVRGSDVQGEEGRTERRGAPAGGGDRRGNTEIHSSQKSVVASIDRRGFPGRSVEVCYLFCGIMTLLGWLGT